MSDYPENGYGASYTVEMPLAEFLAVQECRRQYDTEQHARSAEHLKCLEEIHRYVNIARFLDGSYMLIDGHTRQYMWQNGLTDFKPSTVIATVWPCVNEDAARELYTRFDNEKAAEKGVHRIQGAIKENSLQFQSSMLRRGKFGTAVKEAFWILHGNVQKPPPEYTLVPYWQRELLLIDSVGVTETRFKSRTLTAAFLTFAGFDKDIAMPFWEAYAQDDSRKNGKRFDAVFAFEQILDPFKLAKIMKSEKIHDKAAHRQTVRVAVRCIEAYRRSTMYTNLPQDIEAEHWRKFLDRVRIRKG